MSIYIMLTYNTDAVVIGQHESAALTECQHHVVQVISDVYYHELPLKITPDVIRAFNVRLIRVGPEPNEVEDIKLPFQDWADQYYREVTDSNAEQERREYEKYLQLKAKYEGSSSR